MSATPLTLDSYQLAYATAKELGMSEEGLASMAVKPLRLTLCGDCFLVTATDPTIKIGNYQVTDFEIESNQCRLTCYLYEQPEEGAVISVDYGQGYCGELAQTFSINQLTQDGEPS